MKHASILFLVLLFSSELVAQVNFQKGYIIKPNNDTIYGEIDYRSDIRMGKICNFRTKEGQMETQYTPADLRGYRFTDSKYFVTKEWNGEKVFMEYLINGLISIYYLRDANGDHYFVEKDNEILSEIPYKEKIIQENDKQYLIKPTKYIGLLTYYMKDAPSLQPEIKNMGELTHKNLIKLANDYHNAVCTDGQQCIIYEKKLPPVKINIEARGGFLFDTSFSLFVFQPGILAHIWLPRVNENMFFRTGVLVFNYMDDLRNNYKFWQVPISYEYIFPTKNIVQPKLIYGINLDILSGNYSGGYNINPYAEAGVNIRLNKHSFWSVNLGADFTSSVIGFFIPNKILFLTLSTGFCIKL